MHQGSSAPFWKKGLLATAASLALVGVSVDAQAFALGAVTVRSSLGEPLRAEIEVPQISSEEASTLQATMATPQAFRAAGVEYSPSLSGARVTLHRRPNGQAYLRVVGDKPINEPFLGIVIEANWANGRVVRDYTMLVDPPGRAAPPPVTVTESRTAPPVAPPAPPVAVAPPVAQQTTPSNTAPQERPERQRATPAPRRAAPAPAPSAVEASGGGGQVTVQRGDTAYGIASAAGAQGVSLDQMLVAMLRANPNAFIGGNVNRMRAGAVLNMPTAEQAASVSRRDARRAVVAQTRDFNNFRRGLASRVQSTPTSTASRSASGGVQAQVQDNRAPAPSQDRLTLSKGGTPTGKESQVAQSRQAQEQADRVAELNKNISDLARLQAASGAAPSTTPASAAPPGVTVPVSPPLSAASAPVTSTAADSAALAASAALGAASTAQASASAAVTSASEPMPAIDAAASEAASATMAAASAVEAASAASAEASAAAKPVRPAPAPAPTPVAEPSFLDSLMENPLLPIAGLGVLGLLGYGLYRSRKSKKNAAPLDSAFIESRLQPDSFFGASGGQRVNTKDAGPVSGGASSMAYSPSQLDAAGDVDPVAEADVYLAYGRDMQAEEILKEALRTQPGRVAIHKNLAGIYAKRRDARALEAIATEAYALTGGEGPDWLAITNLGAELDPNNPLYKPGGAPAVRTSPVPTRPSFGADTEPQTAQLIEKKGPTSSGMPLDLDLDLDDAPVRAPTVSAGTATVASASAAAAAGTAAAASLAAREPASAPPPAANAPVDFDLDLDFAPPSELNPHSASASTPTQPPVASSTVRDAGMIDFDMDALSINPDSRSGGELRTEQPDDADEDPLGTKLALAQEFHAIGDTEGARALVKEVIAESSGSLRARAERFLAELS
ncbi:FimV/HubP family polar landmark protein [Ottowia flava]|uniref:FimV/HubP family polar landmark protein n=1 Tax=Ottowia sp. GY511 TaxID=2603274 RepID=UPI00210275C0|nr:FimV/HubP family polar landmark protein [Ottowia sp. GY511]